ncbi:dipeptidyl aminopeptidase/acylaminoacyl peptidase [Kibdelosporangium banguiense]|uniref:Dipeptidyl aminopeptidase/acylaminoacyl peptidase n=1 Tax=Kibdelosporangium banguiense TaxID=1365924 RepID=A0ABS4TDV8_9PSEU|nr:S9 family peptidase [Kibdelosporangium banguiense]MBP2322600.1 dipeptidyl aminopeptidase/acylaminoacyl peptidase [Kibdelosporangium banguiense]
MISDQFSDLDDYVRLPRLSGLCLSPDGRRLVVGVATPDPEKNRYVTALWEVDPAGGRPARRLTRSAEGESSAAFTPSGDLLFVSKRQDDTAALWKLPAEGGEAHPVAAPPGGVRGVVSKGGVSVLAAPLLPSAVDVLSDKDIRAQRNDVTAILYDEFPIRLWDQHLGPDRTRLLAADDEWNLRDITGHVGRALDDAPSWDITPDGRTVVAAWAVAEPGGSQRYTLVAIDVATGERRVLADDPDYEYFTPKISPDGTQVAAVVLRRSTVEDVGHRSVGVVPVAGGTVKSLTENWDRWPRTPHWTPDGKKIVIAADDHGRSPLWLVDAETGAVARLTPDHGAYTDIQISPDGQWVYALRAAIDSPPGPVRIGLDGSTVEQLPGPADDVDLPGTLTEVTAKAVDGTTVRAWLSLPHNASADNPAPLLLWIHGGPYMSYNTWSWRWNPWLMVAKGYAVLQPDPALSSGYGAGFIMRGWGEWGGTPYTDLMSITDTVVERTDIDESRTAAMGASYGGYMANWIAGHTDRFDAIVTHAAVWSLEQEMRTTDQSYDFLREMTEDAVEANSPHRFADNIVTPMLVIHGDKDYRVPIGEALRLWWDLSSRSKGEDFPHRLLYFPDENHWILKPRHTKVWYSTIFAFLAQHVLGAAWQRPEALG